MTTVLQKISILFIVTLLLCTLNQGVWAGTRTKITGEISGVDHQEDSFGVSGPEQNTLLKVDGQTKYRGIKGLAELNLGDVVTVQYNEDLASSVTLKERAAIESPHIPCPKRSQ